LSTALRTQYHPSYRIVAAQPAKAYSTYDDDNAPYTLSSQFWSKNVNESMLHLGDPTLWLLADRQQTIEAQNDRMMLALSLHMYQFEA